MLINLVLKPINRTPSQILTSRVHLYLISDDYFSDRQIYIFNSVANVDLAK